MAGASIVVIGNSGVDLTTYVPHSPAKGETVLGTDFTIGLGGKGSNQAVAAARAGGDVALISTIGRDTFGDLIFDTLSAENLHLDALSRVDAGTGVATIYVEASGDNRIAVFLGASAHLDSAAVQSGLSGHAEARFLVSQLELDQKTVLSALQHATVRGTHTVLNTAPLAPLIEGILENTTWLIANEVELDGLLDSLNIAHDISRITPEQLSEWAEALGCNVIVTLGEQGAMGCARGEEAFSFASPAVEAVDTVGAGDCFVGYFVAFLDSGLGWQEALAGGVIAASESVTRRGAQASYPDPSARHTIRNRAQATAP